MDENENVNDNDNQAPRCMFFNDDEVINVIVNVIVEKNKVAFIFPLVAYQIQNKRGTRFRNFASEIKRVTPL